MASLTLAFWICVGGAVECSPRGDFEVVDPHDQTTHLSDYADRDIVVIVFFDTECPLAKLYAPRVNALAGQYSTAGVAFLGVNSNDGESFDDLGHFAEQQGFRFPLFKDPHGAVANQFGATRQLEAFVLDHSRNVKYHGRVDDQFASGIGRTEPSRDDLKEALEELLSGKSEIAVPETEVSDCLIDRSPQWTTALTEARAPSDSIGDGGVPSPQADDPDAVADTGRRQSASPLSGRVDETIETPTVPGQSMTALSLALVFTIACWLIGRRRAQPRTLP